MIFWGCGEMRCLHWFAGRPGNLMLVVHGLRGLEKLY